MPWLKVDDGEWCAPWVMIVGPTAYGIYTRLAGYCAQALTDGLVPAQIVQIIAAADDGAHMQRLVDVGRVDVRDTGSCTLPFYLDGNPSAAQVTADREARSSKASKAAAARWGNATSARNDRG